MRSTRFRLHVGIEGGREEGVQEREKGVEGGKVAVRVLHGRVGRVAFLLVRLPCFPFGATLHRRATR